MTVEERKKRQKERDERATTVPPPIRREALGRVRPALRRGGQVSNAFGRGQQGGTSGIGTGDHRQALPGHQL